MKNCLLFFGCLLIFESCEKKFCRNSEFSVTLNNESWDGYVKSCYLEIDSHDPDETIQIFINESDPTHDEYKDGLSFTHIPFRMGQYFLFPADSTHDIKIDFSVYESEYGTPTQTYIVVPDGESHIDVKEIDVESKMFQISFFLKMTVINQNGELYNTTYPKDIIFSDGWVEGQIED